MKANADPGPLTKRERVAAMIFAGFAAGEKTMISEYKIAAHLSVKWADALFTQLEKTNGEAITSVPTEDLRAR